MPGERFRAHTEKDGDATVMRLAGELDMSGTFLLEPKLDELAAESVDGDVLFDLRGVTFIDSTGLALLLRSESASRQDGFELQILRSPAPAVRSALEASGLERLLPFVDDGDE